MKREIDELLIETVKKAGVLPEKSIRAGTVEAPEDRTLYLACTALEVQEQGIGSSKSVKKEEATDTFDCDGARKEFRLSHEPVKPLLSVESPPGYPRNEPADYTVDYVNGVVNFREPPGNSKKGLLIRYNIATATGEIIFLKLMLTYSFVATAADIAERNRIVFAIIDTLYKAKDAMVKSGIEDMRVTTARQFRTPEGVYKDTVVLTCELWTTQTITLPPGKAMGKVELEYGKK